MLELTIVLAVAGVLAAIAAPRVLAARDQAVVRDAATELVAVLDAARAAAQRREAVAVAIFDAATATARVFVERDTLFVRALGAELGVTLEATRDSVSFGPSGRGYGAANSSLIVRRGSAVDTVFVSRLGRVRRAR